MKIFLWLSVNIFNLQSQFGHDLTLWIFTDFLGTQHESLFTILGTLDLKLMKWFVHINLQYFWEEFLGPKFLSHLNWKKYLLVIVSDLTFKFLMIFELQNSYFNFLFCVLFSWQVRNIYWDQVPTSVPTIVLKKSYPQYLIYLPKSNKKLLYCSTQNLIYLRIWYWGKWVSI